MISLFRCKIFLKSMHYSLAVHFSHKFWKTPHLCPSLELSLLICVTSLNSSTLQRLFHSSNLPNFRMPFSASAIWRIFSSELTVTLISVAISVFKRTLSLRAYLWMPAQSSLPISIGLVPGPPQILKSVDAQFPSIQPRSISIQATPVLLYTLKNLQITYSI